MPEAQATARRSESTPSPPARPASPHASSAATSASWPERSSRRACTRSRTSAGSTAASAAICVGRSAAHSCLTVSTPDSPDSNADQVLATSPPRGDVAPSPVTTILLTSSLLSCCGAMLGSSGCRGALDVVDGVADGAQTLDVVVRDAYAEALLGGDDDLDHRERVHVEVADELLL